MGCKARCYGCGLVKYGDCVKEKYIDIICNNCERQFFNQQCFENHQKAVCKRYHKCSTCERVYLTSVGEHICGETFCRVCRVYHDTDRGCFIEPIVKEKHTRPTIIAVFDFEVKSLRFTPLDSEL
jgi:hypothetical protein